MARFRTLDELEVGGKRVLVRADLNVPLEDGEVADATRIERLVPTLEELLAKGARVIVLSHFGRPKGRPMADMSLAPVAPALAAALGGRPVVFVPDCIGAAAEAAVAALADGGVALLENLRFHPGEEANDEAFARALARLGEAYVDDAFSCAHRAHASVDRLARLLPAAAGRGMERELKVLHDALDAPTRPVAAVVGGAKVSSKLAALEHLVRKVDVLIIGGGMANTFLHARGLDVGASLCERDLAATARRVEAHAADAGCAIVLPEDAVVAPGLAAGAHYRTVAVAGLRQDEMILDVGPRSVAIMAARLDTARTLVWNGPLGAFETSPFDAATVALARHAAARTRAGELMSVAGGGDTVAALNHASVTADFSYVSTAGGAFLEWLEGRALPGIEALAV